MKLANQACFKALIETKSQLERLAKQQATLPSHQKKFHRLDSTNKGPSSSNFICSIRPMCEVCSIVSLIQKCVFFSHVVQEERKSFHNNLNQLYVK